MAESSTTQGVGHKCAECSNICYTGKLCRECYKKQLDMKDCDTPNCRRFCPRRHRLCARCAFDQSIGYCRVCSEELDNPWWKLCLYHLKADMQQKRFDPTKHQCQKGNCYCRLYEHGHKCEYRIKGVACGTTTALGLRLCKGCFDACHDHMFMRPMCAEEREEKEEGEL